MIRLNTTGFGAAALLFIFITLSAHFLSSGLSTKEYVSSYTPQVKLPESISPSRAATSGSSLQKQTIAAASNSTLGFHKIVSIQMAHRWDKKDAAVLQAYTSGLKVGYYTGVDGKTEIQDTGRIGMPPGAAQKEGLSPGMLGCFRSHANVWSELAEQRLPPVLILESDAFWDINIRPILGLANKHFVEHLQETNSQIPASPFYDTEIPSSIPQGATFDPLDPWQSSHWDVLSFGHCGGQGPADENAPRTYFDPLNGDWDHAAYDIPVGSNRLIHRANSFICLTAYAVSHRGAAKLLLRGARELQEPIDVLIMGMIQAGELITYTVNPPVFTQWEYHHGLGQGLSVTSDIHRTDFNDSVDATKEVDNSGWEEVRKLKSSWINKGNSITFKEPALSVAFQKLVTENTQFVMPDIAGV